MDQSERMQQLCLQHDRLLRIADNVVENIQRWKADHLNALTAIRADTALARRLTDAIIEIMDSK